MARGKKAEKVLTLEEKLEQALVPVEEQPYSIPENWCWTTISKVASHISDGSHNPPKNSESGIPLLSAMNIHNGIIDFDNATRWITQEEWEYENSRNKIELNDVLLTIVATIGRVAVVRTDKRFALQRSVAVLKPRINPAYLAYYLESPFIQKYMIDNAKGTAQKGFYLKSLEQMYCLIAPLSEQQRIVDRIESLFAKLDEAKEKAQAVVDGFELRKSAILHKAFAGELTKQWRKAHGVVLDSWEKTEVGSISDVKGGKRVPKGMSLTTENTGHPYIKAGNLKQGTVLDEGIMYVPDDVLQYIRNYTVNTGDVYITNVGACIGDCGVIPPKYDGANLTENAVKITNLKCDSEFLAWYLSSNIVQQEIKSLIASATLGKLSIANIKTIPVFLPAKEEQAEIISMIKKILSKELQVRECAEIVIDQIDTMKKAILARAFRGELGTNDPTEESAIELLKTVL